MELQFKKLKIKSQLAKNFTLNPLELNEYIDFEVKRVYTISRAHGPSSQHCHLHEKELFIAVAGSCTMVIDCGQGKQAVELRSPEDCVYVGNYVWHGFSQFSDDAVVLALSSTNYNPNREDYIEDYQKYLVEVEKQKSS